MEKINKQVATVNGKKAYLLGINKEGLKVWMPAESWDCGWYWGFGYIQTQHSHSHFNGLCFERDSSGKFIYHINESSEFTSTTLTDSEAWELSDLMKRFYILKEAAEVYGRGTAHYTSNTRLNSKNKRAAKRINEKELPAIFKAVESLLGGGIE